MSPERFLTAVALGLSVAAPIGPVNVEIIRRGLRWGPGAAFSLGCGAVSADCIYFLLAVTLTDQARRLLESPAARGGVLLFGASLLILLGWGAVRAAGAAAAAEADSEPKTSARTALRSWAVGLAITLGNPMTILLWLSIAASLGAASPGSGTAGAPPGGGALWTEVIGVACGALGWVIFLSTLLGLARRRVTPRFLRGVNLVSGALLIGFGVRFLILAATPVRVG